MDRATYTPNIDSQVAETQRVDNKLQRAKGRTQVTAALLAQRNRLLANKSIMRGHIPEITAEMSQEEITKAKAAMDRLENPVPSPVPANTVAPAMQPSDIYAPPGSATNSVLNRSNPLVPNSPMRPVPPVGQPATPTSVPRSPGNPTPTGAGFTVPSVGTNADGTAKTLAVTPTGQQSLEIQSPGFNSLPSVSQDGGAARRDALRRIGSSGNVGEVTDNGRVRINPGNNRPTVNGTQVAGSAGSPTPGVVLDPMTSRERSNFLDTYAARGADGKPVANNGVRMVKPAANPIAAAPLKDPLMGLPSPGMPVNTIGGLNAGETLTGTNGALGLNTGVQKLGLDPLTASLQAGTASNDIAATASNAIKTAAPIAPTDTRASTAAAQSVRNAASQTGSTAQNIGANAQSGVTSAINNTAIPVANFVNRVFGGQGVNPIAHSETYVDAPPPINTTAAQPNQAARTARNQEQGVLNTARPIAGVTPITSGANATPGKPADPLIDLDEEAKRKALANAPLPAYGS